MGLTGRGHTTNTAITAETMVNNAKKEASAHVDALLALAGINIIWGAMLPLTKPALDMIPC